MLKQLYPISTYNVKRVLLLVISGASFLWFGGKAIFELRDYYCLQKHTSATILQWKVEEKGGKSFIATRYSFELGERKYEGETRFKEPIFLNTLSAESEMKKWQSYTWAAWYDPDRPDHSSLQKLFPYKSSVYALIVLGVLGYFFLLNGRLSRERF